MFYNDQNKKKQSSWHRKTQTDNLENNVPYNFGEKACFRIGLCVKVVNGGGAWWDVMKKAAAAGPGVVVNITVVNDWSPINTDVMSISVNNVNQRFM